MNFYLCKNGFVLDNVLVGGEQNIEFGGFHLGLENSSTSWRTFVGNNSHSRRPFFKLQHPVGHGSVDGKMDLNSVQLKLHM
jgi:hypothetical protein